MPNKKDEKDIEFFFSDENQPTLFLEYMDFIKSSVDDFDDRVTTEDLTFSYENFILAVSEINIDIETLKLRRNVEDGISIPKIAGIVVFRFVKYPVIFPKIKDDDCLHLRTINNFIAINFAINKILEISEAEFNNLHSHISKELGFTFFKRHTNQETLGLVFEILHATKKKLLTN